VKNNFCKIFLLFVLVFMAINIASCEQKNQNQINSEKQDLFISDDRDIILSQSKDTLVPLYINGGSLFYVDGARLLEYDISADTETVLIDGITAESICVTSKQTYIYDPEKNGVIEYDSEFNVTGEYLLNEQIGISQKLIKLGDTMLILCNTESGNYGNQIYKISLNDDTQGYLDLKGNMHISDIFFADADSIFIVHFNMVGSAQLTKYDLLDEKNEFTIDDIRASSAYCDIKSGYVYLLAVSGSGMDALYENAEITKAEIINGKLNVISSKKFNNHHSEAAKKFCASDSGYIIFYQDNYVAARKFNEDTSKILNIYMYGTGLTWIESSVRDFQNNFGVEINIISHEDYRFEKIKLKLLANDIDFDLFVIDTASGFDIFNKMAYEPLDSYPGVMKNIGEMYPGMQKLLKYDGNTVGIPMQQVVMTTYAFNEELAQKYGIEPPAAIENENGIWTIDEYYEYAKYVKEKSGGVVYFNSIFWMGAYMTEYINPKTGELTDDGENLKRILKWDKDFLELWDEDIRSNPENNLLDWSKSATFVQLYDETLVPVPVINKNSKKETMYWMLCINRYSPNKDLAAQFLEYMTAEKHRYERMAPILFNKIEKYSNETKITDRMRHNSDYLDVLYENSTFGYQVRDDYFTQLYIDLSEKYRNNEITLDNIANELYNKLKMITGE